MAVRCVQCGLALPEGVADCPQCAGNDPTADRALLRGGLIGGLKGLFLGLLPALVLLMEYGAERGIKAIAFAVPVATFTTGLIIGLVKARRDGQPE